MDGFSAGFWPIDEGTAVGMYAPLPPHNERLENVYRLFAAATRPQRLKYLYGQGYPAFVYKYRGFDPSDPVSVDRVRDVIVHSRLWLSSPDDFNDPFDMSAKVIIKGTALERRSRIAKLVQRHSKEQDRNGRRHQKRVINNLSDAKVLQRFVNAHRVQTSATGVYSFAGDPKNIVMWSHYGANHEGICYIFAVGSDPETFLRALTVEYESEYPIINALKETADQIEPPLLRKHPSWQYEQERRIVVPGGAHKYKSFLPGALVGVIMGCRISNAARDKLREIVFERDLAGLPGLRLYQAQLHDAAYKLVVYRNRS